MPRLLVEELYTMPAAGATKTFAVDDVIDIYRLYPNGGAIALLADMIFSVSGSPKKGHYFEFQYYGGVTVGAFNVTIFGTALTAAQALYPQKITAYYNGSTWEIDIIKDSQSGNADLIGGDLVAKSVVNGKLADYSVTVLQEYGATARGYIKRGSGTNTGSGFLWEDFAAATSGQVVAGDGNDVRSLPFAGDVTLAYSANTLVSTIGAGKVTAAMLAFTLADQLLEASLTIPVASVLTLNGTPLTIVAAPGAGKYIEVVSASSCMTFVSAAYAANTTLRLINGVIPQLQDTAILLSTVTKNTKFKDVTSAAAGQTQIVANSALTVDVATGNPTTGDSILVVKVLYRIVTI